MPSPKIEVEFSSKLGDREIRVKHDTGRNPDEHYITLQESDWGTPLMIPIDMIPMVMHQVNQMLEKLLNELKSQHQGRYIRDGRTDQLLWVDAAGNVFQVAEDSVSEKDKPPRKQAT